MIYIFYWGDLIVVADLGNYQEHKIWRIWKGSISLESNKLPQHYNTSTDYLSGHHCRYQEEISFLPQVF